MRFNDSGCSLSTNGEYSDAAVVAVAVADAFEG